jgi:hypothetical protein
VSRVPHLKMVDRSEWHRRRFDATPYRDKSPGGQVSVEICPPGFNFLQDFERRA